MISNLGFPLYSNKDEKQTSTYFRSEKNLLMRGCSVQRVTLLSLPVSRAKISWTGPASLVAGVRARNSLCRGCFRHLPDSWPAVITPS